MPLQYNHTCTFWRQFKIKRTYLKIDLIGDKIFVKQTKMLSSSKERRF